MVGGKLGEFDILETKGKCMLIRTVSVLLVGQVK